MPFLQALSEAERTAFIERATLESRHFRRGEVLLQEVRMVGWSAPWCSECALSAPCVMDL